MINWDLIIVVLLIVLIVVSIICLFILVSNRNSNKKNNFHQDYNGCKDDNIGRKFDDAAKKRPVEATSNNSVKPYSDIRNNIDVSRPLTKKQLYRQRKKEEQQKKKAETQRRIELLEAEQRRKKEAQEEEKRRKAFNPKLAKPDNATYSDLTVSDGRFALCEIGKTPYYRAWNYEGMLYYEFFCEPSKVAKAINNHSVILDPFCDKDAQSASAAQSKNITTIQYGKMDLNFNIIDKSIIKYE